MRLTQNATRFKWVSLLDLDFDLDSTRIQVDVLGHTPTPFLSVKSCHQFFPGELLFLQIFLNCAYPVSSYVSLLSIT